MQVDPIDGHQVGGEANRGAECVDGDKCREKESDGARNLLHFGLYVGLVLYCDAISAGTLLQSSR